MTEQRMFTCSRYLLSVGHLSKRDGERLVQSHFKCCRDGKMLQGFKTEEELHLFAQLYFFEPEFTDEELRQMDEAAAT